MKKQNQHRIQLSLKITAFLCVGSLLLACGDKPVDPKEVITQKALARWEDRKTEKFDNLYNYLSPSKRKTYSIRSYLAGVGTELIYQEIVLKEIVCDNTQDIKQSESCTARLFVKFKDKKRGIDGSAFVNEKWIKEDNDWWLYQ